MIVRAAYISIYLKIVLVLWLLCACPFLDEQFAVAQNKAYFDKNGVAALEREHAVFREVFGQVNYVFAVFSSKQSSFSFANHKPVTA